MKRDFAKRAACGIVAAHVSEMPDEPAREGPKRAIADRSRNCRDQRTHLIDTPMKPADLLFVFGTREDVDERVDEAVRLWREGYFRWSIVSGGITPGSERSGMRDHQAEAMVVRGIPAELILRESIAR